MITSAERDRLRIPRDKEHDYTHQMAVQPSRVHPEQTGAELSHIAQYSFTPEICPETSNNSSEWRRFPSELPVHCS